MLGPSTKDTPEAPWLVASFQGYILLFAPLFYRQHSFHPFPLRVRLSTEYSRYTFTPPNALCLFTAWFFFAYSIFYTSWLAESDSAINLPNIRNIIAAMFNAIQIRLHSWFNLSDGGDGAERPICLHCRYSASWPDNSACWDIYTRKTSVNITSRSFTQRETSLGFVGILQHSRFHSSLLERRRACGQYQSNAEQDSPHLSRWKGANDEVSFVKLI